MKIDYMSDVSASIFRYTHTDSEFLFQSLFLASALMRAMWSRGGLGGLPGALGGAGAAGGAGAGTPPLADETPLRQPPPACKPIHNSSSEASVSMDQTNSDDDPVSTRLQTFLIVIY